jgi:SRSO17 transposase
MSQLKTPQAAKLLQDAVLHAPDIAACAAQLQLFVQRYLPCFYREEQRRHAHTILQGKLTGLQRKTTEPIAHKAGLKRRPLQLFVGAGKWEDQTILKELRCHVREELADPDAVFILDGSGFPKKGEGSCGVARQWCGRLGKVDNCQAGVFVAYAAPRGCTLLDARLYLPEDWANDRTRRLATYVPSAVRFQEKWRIARDLLDRVREELPGKWVTGDDEFGRCTELRAYLRGQRLSYVLDVPCNTHVRDVSERRPPSHPKGKPRLPLFERVDQWVERQPKGRWRTVTVRNGEKEPLRVRVLLATVQTRDEDGCVGPRERLAVLRSVETKSQTWYTLSNEREAHRGVLARVHGSRHRVEELLEQGNQEVGLDHYEVRSWTGWHHHMTLSLLALWFLQLEKLRLGKKNTGGDGAAGAGDLHGTVADGGSERGGDREGDQPHAAA